MRLPFVCAALSAVALSHAAVLFGDDFESGTLVPKWIPNNGQIVDDPLVAGNHVVNFNALGSGGNMFQSLLIATPATGTTTLSFDYLGQPDATSGLTSGGFLGTNDLTGEHWYFGTGGYPSTVTLIDDGAWHHYSIVVPNSDLLQIKLEDYVGSDAIIGNAYFDNIQLTSSVPGPESMAVFGIAALASRRRRRATR